MNNTTISINGEVYKVKFGFLANKILAKRWGLKTLSEIGNTIAGKLNFKENEEPTLEQLEAIGELIYAGVLSVHTDEAIGPDDVVDALLKDTDKLQELIQLYIDSMPKAEPSKNVKPGK